MKSLLCLLLLVSLPVAALDLNSMSKAEYTQFNKDIFAEFKTDAQATGEKAKQIIIGMAGLEARPEAHKMFETDVVFTVNSMMLLVANANKIKRQAAFIEDYKKQAAGVEAQLSGEALTYCKVFTAMVIAESEKLP